MRYLEQLRMDIGFTCSFGMFFLFFANHEEKYQYVAETQK